MGQQRRLQTEKQELNTNRPLGDSKDLDSLIKRKKNLLTKEHWQTSTPFKQKPHSPTPIPLPPTVLST